jgi:hypothetical protein
VTWVAPKSHSRLLRKGSSVGILAFVFLVFASLTGLLLVCIWLRHLASFTKPSINEVEDFVKALHRPKLEEVFDPVKNQERRSNPTRYSYRREHRVVVEVMRDNLLVMLGNASFLRHWGKTEWYDMRKYHCQYSEETIQRIRNLIRCATVFQTLASRALFVVWIWRLSGFDEWILLPLPDVARLRTIAGVDILEAYAQLRRAAEALAQEYGEQGKEIARYISMSMLGPNEVGV